MVRWPHRGERAFDDVRRAQMLPVLGREVVEGEQRVAILDQALDRLVVFDASGLDEGVEGRPVCFSNSVAMAFAAICVDPTVRTRTSAAGARVR
jgi:hypothetical protein